MCLYVDSEYKYQYPPVRNEILIAPGRGVNPIVANLVLDEATKNKIPLAHLRQVYPVINYQITIYEIINYN